jgi:uncharacterized membrane protein
MPMITDGFDAQKFLQFINPYLETVALIAVATTDFAGFYLFSYGILDYPLILVFFDF